MDSPIRKVDKPWGYELIFAHTDRYAGKILHVDPDQALSLQYHEHKDETLYLLSGEYELVIDQEGETVTRTVQSGEAIHVPPGTRHRMTSGPEGCDIIEVSTPELDDVVRLEDRYGRV